MRRLVLLALLAAFAAPAAVAGSSFPNVIPLPNGWQPEGIAVGNGHTFYVGSLANGAVFRGDLRTGKGAVLVPGVTGRVATGLKFDHGRLFVSGAGTGKAFVFDARSGGLIREYQLATGAGPTFVNDVVVTKDGAWFTDSNRAVLYRVPLSAGHALGPTPQTLNLTGQFQLVAGFNLNGIAATPSGKTLIAVQTNTGKLFTIDPTSGATHLIDLGGGSVPNGDGILLHGRTLYVVQNQDNTIAVIRLSTELTSGTIVGHLTNGAFDVPTTLARFGDRLYAVNARFTTPPTPSTAYQVVQVRR